MKAALIDTPRRARWNGSRALVPVDRTVCPCCGGPVAEDAVHQPALFRHGGYGATVGSRSRSCSRCGWSLLVERSEGRPL